MCQFCAERCRRLPAARLRLVPPPRPPPLRPTAHRQTQLCCMLLSHGSLARSLAACPRRGSCLPWPRSLTWTVPLLRPRSLPLSTTSPLSRRGRSASPAPARWRPAGSSPTRSATPSASGARPPRGVATRCERMALNAVRPRVLTSGTLAHLRRVQSRCCLPTHRAGRGRRGARRQRISTRTSSTRTRCTCT